MSRTHTSHAAKTTRLRGDADLPRVSIVVVTYNSREFLETCIEALRLETEPFEAIIIDNNSVDGTRSLLSRMARPDLPLQVVLNDENVGFATACNQGTALSRGEYLLFLNPDAVAEAEVVKRMASYMDRHPDTGVLGPKVIGRNGRLQLSCGREPNLYYRIFEALRLPRLSKKLFGGYRYWDWNHSVPRDVTWVSGCCLMVRPELFRNLGGFDESFFLFEEDIDLCQRIIEMGHRVVYWPDAVVRHTQGESSKSDRAFSLVTSYRSKLHFSKKYGDQFEYTVLRCLFPVISVAKSLAARVLAVVKRNPAYKGTSRAHWQAARALVFDRNRAARSDDASARVTPFDSK